MINVLIATHGDLALGFKSSLEMLAGNFDNLYLATFENGASIDDYRSNIKELLSQGAPEQQWIILCDILGGTPFKIVSEFSYKNDDIVVLYGINLPVLLQVILDSSHKTIVEMKNDLEQSISESIGISTI